MPITRIFNTADDAASAVAELRQFGYGTVGVSVAPGASGTVVTADAPFGTAGRVTQILQRPRPGDTGVVNAVDSGAVHTSTEHARLAKAAPLSSALDWPLLSRNPAPLSSLFGLPILSRRQRSKTTLLSNRAAPLSALTQLPTLSRNAAPLSSLLGVKVLSQNPAPLSSLVNAPVLSKNQR